MKLPQLNPRVKYVQDVKVTFLNRIEPFYDNAINERLDYGDLLKAFNQISLNLLSKGEVVYHNNFQRDVEKVIVQLMMDANLTIGEVLSFLQDRSNQLVQDIIRWERN